MLANVLAEVLVVRIRAQLVVEVIEVSHFHLKRREHCLDGLARCFQFSRKQRIRSIILFVFFVS